MLRWRAVKVQVGLIPGDTSTLQAALVKVNRWPVLGPKDVPWLVHFSSTTSVLNRQLLALIQAIRVHGSIELAEDR